MRVASGTNDTLLLVYVLVERWTSIRLEPVLQDWWHPFSGPFIYHSDRRVVPFKIASSERSSGYMFLAYAGHMNKRPVRELSPTC